MAHDIEKLTKILQHIRPGAQWTIQERPGGDCDLTWYDTIQARPTDAEIDAGADAVDALAYRDRRAAEYPPLAEFAEAYAEERAGRPEKMNAYLAKCEAVREKYPKGS